jgi:hypothetical protein
MLPSQKITGNFIRNGQIHINFNFQWQIETFLSYDFNFRTQGDALFV